MASGNQILRVFIWLWRLLCQKLLLSFFCLRHWTSLAKAGWDSCALLVKAKLPFTKDGCSLCQIDVQNCPKSLIKIRAAFVSFCHWKAKEKGREKSRRNSWRGGVKEKPLWFTSSGVVCSRSLSYCCGWAIVVAGRFGEISLWYCGGANFHCYRVCSKYFICQRVRWWIFVVFILWKLSQPALYLENDDKWPFPITLPTSCSFSFSEHCYKLIAQLSCRTGSYTF